MLQMRLESQQFTRQFLHPRPSLLVWRLTRPIPLFWPLQHFSLVKVDHSRKKKFIKNSLIFHSNTTNMFFFILTCGQSICIIVSVFMVKVNITAGIILQKKRSHAICGKSALNCFYISCWQQVVLGGYISRSNVLNVA